MKTTILTTFLIIFTLGSSAQVAITTDGSSADGSAMLEVKSTEKGFLPPRMTEVQRDDIDSPATSLIIYQTDGTKGLYYYNGSAWKAVSQTADGSETKVIAGTNITVTGAGTIASPYVINVTGSTTLAIGQAYQGGIIFWLDATGQHGLIAATVDHGTDIQWYNGSNTTTGATLSAVYAGKANTNMIIANQGAGSYAAQLCADYSVTVNNEYYDDWYLPSKYELNLLYQRKTAVGGLANAFYWSSSEGSISNAWCQSFYNGSPGNYYKSWPTYVRGVRAF